MAPVTVGEALANAIERLRAAGVDSPRLDAELLLAAVSGRERAGLVASPEAILAADAAAHFEELLARRAGREPLAYILGRKGFRHIELDVNPDVLIPRPETELLVEIALELEPLAVLDVGTGSGAVALAIAHELPNATVVATDTSPLVFVPAVASAARLGLAERVRFEPGSLPRSGSFDLLVSNLPYVAEADWEGLEPELREHEPRGALVAGPTGLEAIDTLLSELSLEPEVSVKALAFEVGEGQAATVAELVRRAGYEEISIRPDLAGIDRVVVGR